MLCTYLILMWMILSQVGALLLQSAAEVKLTAASSHINQEILLLPPSSLCLLVL